MFAQKKHHFLPHQLSQRSSTHGEMLRGLLGVWNNLRGPKKIEQVVAQSLIAAMLNAKKLGKYQAEVRHLSHA